MSSLRRGCSGKAGMNQKSHSATSASLGQVLGLSFPVKAIFCVLSESHFNLYWEKNIEEIMKNFMNPIKTHKFNWLS